MVLTVENLLGKVWDRYVNVKSLVRMYEYSNDLPPEEITYLNIVLDKLERDIDGLSQRAQELFSKYEHLRFEKSESAGYVEEYDDSDTQFNDLTLIGGQNADLIADINDTLKLLESYINTYGSPYFGSMDISIEGRESSVYLGKVGVKNDNLSPLVIDWRAPVSILFYTNNQPVDDVEFELDNKKVRANFLGKRYYDISRGKLLDIYESNSGSRGLDRYLSAVLKEKKSSKLTDIVATLQGIQAKIVSVRKGAPLVIQGVAGSGKSTILFHRLSYLIYNYGNDFVANNSLLIVPNVAFKQYVSDIVHSLGLGELNVFTYEEWVRMYINLDSKLILGSGAYSKETANYLSSLDLKNDLRQSIFEYVLELIKSIPSDIVNADYISYLLAVYMKYESKDIPIAEKLVLALEHSIFEYLYENFTQLSEGKKERKYDQMKEKLDAYLSLRMRVEVVCARVYEKLSSRFIDLNEKHSKNGLIEFVNTLIENPTWEGISEAMHYTLMREDFPVLKYIHSYIHGNIKKYDFVSIDEAQDITPLKLDSLYILSKKQNIILAGDFSQKLSVTQYAGWKNIINDMNIFGSNNVEYFELNTSYRMTKEIVEGINMMLGLKMDFEAQLSIPGSFAMSEFSVDNIVYDITDSSYSNIAVICATEQKRDEVSQQLSSLGLSNIVNNEWGADGSTGLWVLTDSSARGLEFDVVYLYGYDLKNISNPNQVYIAMTRAMKKLVVIVE